MMSSTDERVDLTQYWRVLLRRRWLLIGPLAVVLVGALIGGRLARPVYESSAIVLIQSRQPLSRSLEQLLLGGNHLGNRERADALAERVRSPEYLRSVIRSLGLAGDPQTRLTLADARGLEPEDPLLDGIIVQGLVQRLRRMVDVESRGTNLFRLAVRGEDPNEVYQIAVSLLEVVRERALQDELDNANSVQQFSSDQLALYRERLVDAEERLTEYRKQVAAASVGPTVVNGANLNRALSLVDQFDSDIQTMEEGLRSYSSAAAALGGRLARRPDVQRLVDEVLTGAVRLVPLYISSSWMDPEVMHQSGEVTRRRDEVEVLLVRLVAEESESSEHDDAVGYTLASVDMRVAQAKRQRVQELISAYRSQVVEAPEQDLTLTRLEAEVEGNREIYNMLLEQSGAAEISKAVGELEVERRFEVLVPPSPPMGPVSPDRQKTLFLGALVGLVLGMVVVFVAEYADRSLKSVDEAERYLELPVLGTIPRIVTEPGGRVRQLQGRIGVWRHRMAEAVVSARISKVR
jgi:succinoglycan biosynthesis transport protein ExoP